MPSRKGYWLLPILVLSCVLSYVLFLTASIPPVSTGTWQTWDNMGDVRAGAAAVLLQDGQVLIIGGTSANGPVASADLFGTDGVFSAAAAMQTPRSGHTATVLSDGRVLVTGGTTSGGGAVNTAEIYDPSANSWSAPATTVDARAGHTASLLSDGRVLLVGGHDSAGNALSSLEIFDPASGKFSSAGTMSVPRMNHAAASLGDGRVFMIGGTADGTNALASIDIYDPSAGTVSAGPILSTPRMSATATTTLDGKVVVIGGNNGSAFGSQDLASAEIFDPASGLLSPSASSLVTARSGHQAFLLPKNNAILVLGGSSAGTDLNSAEIYYPWADSFHSTGAMSVARPGLAGSAVGLDGRFLAAGGTNLSSTELYGFATVKTDAADYPPGSTVTITGSGWQPGETVTLTLVESPLIDTHGPYTVNADANGNITDSSFTTDSHDASVKFTLTAVGSVSQAQMTFTDAGSFTYASTPSPASLSIPAGNSDSFTESVTAPKNNGTFSATLVMAGTIPSSWMSLNPVGSQSFATGGPGGSAVTNSWTVTINVPTGTADGIYTGTITASVTIGTGPTTGSGTDVTVRVGATTGTKVGSVTVGPQIGTATYGTGGSVTYTVTVNRGASGTFTANLTIGALPSGVSAGFSPSSLSFASAETSHTSTLTLTTTNTTPAGSSNFEVTATNASASGDAATRVGALTVNQAIQTISFGALSNRTYGDAPFTVSATGGASGNPVTFSSTTTGVCTTSGTNGSTVTIVAAGTCSIKASQAGNTNYNAAPDVTQSFTVNPAALTASIIGDPTKPYDGTTTATLTSANFSISGLVGTDSFTVTQTSGTYNSPNVVGATTVTAGLTSGNFTAGTGTMASNYVLPTTASGAGQINARPATWTTNPASKTYGDLDPVPLTTGGGNFLVADGVTATYSRATGETVLGGPYHITATLAPAGVLTNYTITNTGADFTITPRPASVTPNAASKIYGSTDPALSGTLSGFLVADAVTATYSRTTGETVAGSPYTISATLSPAGVLGNYNITYNTANFTITPKAASVTPNAASKIYGSADPALSGTLSGFLAADAVTATYSRTTGETVAGSPYTISATLSPAGVLGNYNITYNTANFTITPKAASVTPNAASKIYGSADPALSGTLSGFLAADAVTATYSRTAGETVAGSPYTISATLSPVGVLGNYNITYNTANFTITPKAASVTPNAASKIYGSADPALSGTLSGFLAADAVTATYSRTAGETVAGSPYTISATLSPAGVLGNYNITYNTANFTITPRPASVTPNAASKIYGSTDPALSGTLSGFLAADAVTATYSRTAGETVAGSPYTISATLSPAGVLGNYNITYNTANFTITPKAASVTPNAASKIYGSTDPALSGTLSGFLAPDAVTATYSRTTGETVAGSPYTISATLSPAGVLGNYNITYNTANFTITPKAASVTPNAASKIYGSADPALSGTLSGFLAADAVTATYSRTAGETVAGSPYTISATLSPVGVLGNYNITYNTANFTITPKAASVTPNAASKIYGSTDPALSGTLSGFLAADSVTATYSRTAGETVAGSPYTISATLSPAGVLGNYNITYNTANFTITPRPASVTPNAASKIYGSTDLALSGTLSGFLAADAVTATYSRTAGETVAGSPYTISATLSPAGVLGNYNITYNTANFTITPKAASVTPNAASKIYGSTDPALSGTLSGFLAPDAVTATYSRTTGETVAGSPYTISATLSPAGVLGNYNITYNTANFTITKADTGTTVVSSASPSVFGQLVTFTATVSDNSPGSTGTPTGTVTFKDGATTLGTGTLNGSGLATFATSSLSVSSHSITAEYGGDANFNGSTSALLNQVVNKANTTTTITSDSPDPSTVGGSYTVNWSVTVNAPGAGTPTGTVTVNDGNGNNCSASVGAGSCSLTSTSVGAKILTATYSGDSNFNGSFGTGQHNVQYRVCLLYDPTRAVKSGATYPLKLYLCDVNGNDVSSSGIIVHATSIFMASGFSGPPEDAGNANPDSDFRFDSTLGPSGGYIFNLQTKGLGTGTYGFTFTASNDPTTHTVLPGFGVK